MPARPCGCRPLLVGVVGLLATGWLLAAPPAAAHALVVATNPDAGARLTSAPTEVRVVFSEPVRPLGAGLFLRGPRGEVRLGPAQRPPGHANVLAAALPHLAAGAYTTSWRIVSVDDGHVEAGTFAFAVGADVAVPTASGAAPQLPPPGLVTGRWVAAGGVLVLAGVVIAALTVWRRPGPIARDEPPYLRLVLVAAGVGAVGVALEVGAAAGTAAGGTLLRGLSPGAVRSFLAASPDAAWRAALELLAVGGTVVAVRRGAARGRRPGVLALVLAVAAVAMLVAGAHATGLRPRWLFVTLETAHLLAVAVWVGGLVALAATGRRTSMAAVRRFSVLALRAVMVIAVTGIWQALAEVPNRAALTGTDYGRVLVVKGAVVLAVVGLGAAARFWLVPRTSGDASPPSLRRLLGVEAGGALAVVLVAALLGNTVPAAEVADARAAVRVPGGPQGRQLVAGPLRLDLALEPGTVGPNTLSVHVRDRRGRPLDGLARIGLVLSDSAGRSAPVPLQASRVAPATYRATGAFAVPGRWQVGVAVPGATPELAVAFGIAAGAMTAGQPPPDPADALALGGRAGGALVGLAAFAAGSALVVRVRGGIGSPAAVVPRLRLAGPGGRTLTAPLQRCGDGCLEAFLAAPPRGFTTVLATLPAGTARFDVPLPLPGSGAARLRAADRTLAAAGSYRIHEVLSSGLGAVYRTDYTLEAPDRARWHLDTGSETADTVWIGEDRYTREGTGPWKHERTAGVTIAFPARNWSDREANVADFGPSTWHGQPARLLAFVDPANGAYHKLWVDPASRILHERMDAPGHFMDRDYSAYRVPVTIRPPR